MIALPYGFGLTLGGALVALVIALLAAGPFARPLRQGGGAVAGFAGMGAVVFLVAVLVVQVPVQSALGEAAANDLSPFWLGDHVWAVPLALALVAALLQEGARLGAVALSVRLRRPHLSPVAVGAAVGAGIGLVEAAMILGSIPPAEFSVVSVAVLERVSAVSFHVGAGALLGAGLARGRTWWAFALALLLHWLIDGLAAVHAVGLVSLATVEGVALVVGVGLLAFSALALGRPARRAPGIAVGAG